MTLTTSLALCSSYIGSAASIIEFAARRGLTVPAWRSSACACAWPRF